MSLVDEKAFARGHIPLSDSCVGTSGDDEGIVGAHTVYVTDHNAIASIVQKQTRRQSSKQRPITVFFTG